MHRFDVLMKEFRIPVSSRFGLPAAAAAVIILMAAVTGCGETTNVTQNAGGDAKACVNNSTCVEAEGPPPVRRTEVPATDLPTPEVTRAERSAIPPQPHLPPGEASSEAAAIPPPETESPYLSQHKPVGGFGNDRKAGDAELQDGTHLNSVIFSVRSFGAHDLSLTYNVLRGAKRFETKAGLDMDTPDGCKVSFEMSGAARGTFEMTPGHVHDVKENLNGSARLTLRVVVTQWPQGVFPARCRAVWGSAAFL
ncbi:hypothetical protein RM717_00195 [Streptomyces griseus]|uniref:Glycosyl hydrolase family 98 putative carbohydrate-binding module domain-containing protein n=1 Tax=Streptomyces stephensoniae TaxID=3375367 RepID=A0ABU2VVL1_9ACTN|nr:hypothetical protein [Streptomyces griseus]MDT0488922.1 hypothetical protein [Streptomyces griseus]